MHVFITPQIDLAEIVLYGFLCFFGAIVFYLRREDKREGYPLIDPARGQRLFGFPAPPELPKLYRLRHGGVAEMPHETAKETIPATPLFRFPGAPLVPDGDPMRSGMGPGTFPLRRDEPLLTWEGDPQVVPLRSAPGWRVAEGDPDPRGMTVIAGDRVAVGEVVDLWLDHGVKILRYLEVRVADAIPRTALLPIYYADIRARRREVRVSALLSRHFSDVPSLRDPDSITAREEDQVNAYYSAGLLYAKPFGRSALR